MKHSTGIIDVRAVVALALMSAGCVASQVAGAAPKHVGAAVGSGDAVPFGEYVSPSPLKYHEFFRTAVYVPVRDGTRLALDIYRPAVDGKPVSGKLPTVFEFTRYWRGRELPDGRLATLYFGNLQPGQTSGTLYDAPDKYWAVNLVQHGYVVAVGDTRGTGASFGSSDGPHTPTESKDEHDLIEWMAAQPWSDGNFGLTGDSYTGTNTYLALTQYTPHIKAIFPAMPNYELYATAVYGGVFRKSGVVAVFQGLKSQREATNAKQPMPMPVDGDADHALMDKAMTEHGQEGYAGYTAFLYTPAMDHVAAELNLKTTEDRLRVLANTANLIPEIAARPDLQRELMTSGYFRGPGQFDFSPPNGEKSITVAYNLNVISKTGVPVYGWGGWRDFAPVDSFLYFANVKTPQKLTVGPWKHWPKNMRGDLREEEAVRIRAVEELRWFDHWLKGIDNGVMNEPAINYAVVSIGEGTNPTWRWKATDKWPPPESVPTDFYFAAGRSGTVRSVNDGLLSQTPPTDSEAADSYFVDYSATTGTKTRFHDGANQGPIFYPDLTPNDAKGLTYTTNPLEHDLTIAGFPVVTIYATSTAPDGEFDVYIEDIDPYGFSTFLQDGYMRALNRTLGNAPWDTMGMPYLSSQKRDADKASRLNEGIAMLKFPLQPIAERFKAGHRIRITIEGTDADSDLTFPAVPPPKVTVSRNPTYPSKITLPVMPDG